MSSAYWWCACWPLTGSSAPWRLCRGWWTPAAGWPGSSPRSGWGCTHYSRNKEPALLPETPTDVSRLRRSEPDWFLSKPVWMRRGGFHLEMRAGDAGCDLLEERLLDPDELGWLDHVQDLLDLAEKHYLNAKPRDSSARNLKGKKKTMLEGCRCCSPLSACTFWANIWAALWWSAGRRTKTQK